MGSSLKKGGLSESVQKEVPSDIPIPSRPEDGPAASVWQSPCGQSNFRGRREYPSRELLLAWSEAAGEYFATTLVRTSAEMFRLEEINLPEEPPRTRRIDLEDPPVTDAHRSY